MVLPEDLVVALLPLLHESDELGLIAEDFVSFLRLVLVITSNVLGLLGWGSGADRVQRTLLQEEVDVLLSHLHQLLLPRSRRFGLHSVIHCASIRSRLGLARFRRHGRSLL